MAEAATLHWQPYKLLRYEQDLGIREVARLVGAGAARTSAGAVRVNLNGTPPSILGRVTYFSEVEVSGGSSIVPTQARLEESVKGGPSKRQRTRYSSHGLHEYHGKFNPQVVRAIGNVLGVGPQSTVLDPFCGSGTTLLEGAHSGWKAVGLDLNPLAVVIANAKLAALRSSTSLLCGAVDDLKMALESLASDLESSGGWSRQKVQRVHGLPHGRLENAEYLERWFEEPVLTQIEVVLGQINSVIARPLRPVARIVLSDILREASLQEPADLRMRRRKNPAANYPVISTFLESVEAKLGAVARARDIVGFPGYGQRALMGDTRNVEDVELATQRTGQLFDAVISSPPYLTALPYIDTQRFSLCLLGLAESKELAALDRRLIGSRELPSDRLNDVTRPAADSLPRSVSSLCRDMQVLLAGSSDGFRRRRMPGLTRRYFVDMLKAFRAIRLGVVAGGMMALVVGSSRTRLGGKQLLIDTPTLLLDTAQKAGWHPKELVQLDTYQRFGLHHRNSIQSESLLVLENRAAG